MRILHIEDDADLRRFIKEGLKREGFAVDGAPEAKEGVQLAAENVYDMILVDIGMPGLNGYWAIRTLRQAGQTVGIFVISGQGGEDDKLEAYNAGADDYLVKPIFLRELVAKIRQWMRRRDDFLSSEAPATLLEVGPIQLDLLKHKTTVNGRVVLLTPKEFMVLEYLMRHPGRVVTQTAIAQAVWSLDHDTGTNVVEFHINHLRKKIGEPGKESILKTVRGSGYMIEVDGDGPGRR
jgi:two-component system, OmpR family, response regulator